MAHIPSEEINLKILLIDDHPLFTDGLKHLLAILRKHVIVDIAIDFAAAIASLQKNRDYDLVLLDLGLPDISGEDAITSLRSEFPLIPLVVLTASEDRRLFSHAFDKGAQGYIPKSTSSEVLISALNLVLSGGMYIPKLALATQPLVSVKKNTSTMPTKTSDRLATEPPKPSIKREYKELFTQRQLKILVHISNGLSNKEIARELDIAEGTVRVHMSTAYRLLNVNNRTQAVIKARKLGIFD